MMDRNVAKEPPGPAYDEGFFAAQQEGSRRSARRIVPLVVEWIQPRTVVDVGCGVGTWLSVFREHGIEEVCGIDGTYVVEFLEIPHERFIAHDLTTALRLDRQFDLVVSLEVAEHLPSECAEAFVELLTRLGPVVLFSAAIPFQGGTHHLNEQWPDYWAALFDRYGYAVIDAVRPRVWQDPHVEWWYAQNTLLFVRRNRLADYPSLAREFDRTSLARLPLVHPRKYMELADWMQRVELVRRDIAAVVPAGRSFIFVDEARLEGAVPVGRRTLPFLERDGQYWGPPPDNDTAIEEFERLRRTGARSIVFGWPAFWWLDHYSTFVSHLRSRFRCQLANDRVVAFDLGGEDARDRGPS
jgi:SAM-dependent methyltransferase